jgi:hypothetical protein
MREEAVQAGAAPVSRTLMILAVITAEKGVGLLCECAPNLSDQERKLAVAEIERWIKLPIG